MIGRYLDGWGHHPAHGTSAHKSNCGSGVTVSTVTIKTALSANVVAGADAVGTDTLATVNVNLRVVERGLMSYASGSASALAMGQTAAGGTPFGSTYAMADLFGADLIAFSGSETYGQGGSATKSLASQQSTIGFLAIDLAWIEDSDVVGDQVVGNTKLGPGNSLSGNLATGTVHAEAIGDNSYADVQMDLIAVEDTFSSATAITTAAVDQETTYRSYTGSRRGDIIHTTNGDSLVKAGDGNDMVLAQGGDDWIWGGDGCDIVLAGCGDDTVFGGEGSDCLTGGDGADWLFGGKNNDALFGGNGIDLLLGDKGADRLEGGDGNDLLCGGDGDDTVLGGNGNDLFRLGLAGGDDDDVYWGGKGADLFLISGDFEDDVIKDFRLSEGDRLLLRSGDWESDASLRALNGGAIELERARNDADDLIITFDFGSHEGQLVLDEFFTLNAGFNAAPKKGEFTDAQALPLLKALFGDDAGTFAAAESNLFTIGDYLSPFG